jgi:hypothetical protein
MVMMNDDFLVPQRFENCGSCSARLRLHKTKQCSLFDVDRFLSQKMQYRCVVMKILKMTSFSFIKSPPLNEL